MLLAAAMALTQGPFVATSTRVIIGRVAIQSSSMIYLAQSKIIDAARNRYLMKTGYATSP
jgi:hypothetical protein